jgi:hypothetical protein
MKPSLPSRFTAIVAVAVLVISLVLVAAGAAWQKPKRQPIVLLDLNYTFVENQAETAKLGGEDFGRRLEFESYRRWLLDLVRDGHVILITARPEKYRERTLARIDSLLGWKPDEAYFNEHDLMPAVCKQQVLLTRIFPKYGLPSDGTRYLAVESNPRTAFMYAGYGIPALRVWDDWQYVDSTRASK